MGCAYFGFIDTDLVRAAYAQPSAKAVNARSPGFLRNPIPLPRAIDAIERGVQERSARVWAPRWVGIAIALRGVLQPLVERGALRETGAISEALRLAETGRDESAADPLLGISAQALEDGADQTETRPPVSAG